MKTWNKPESVDEIDNAHKKYDLARGVAKKLENLARFKVSSKIASPIKNLPPEQQQNPQTEQENRPEESPNQPATQTAIQKSASKRSRGSPCELSLLPGNAGSGGPCSCDVAWPSHQTQEQESAMPRASLRS